MNITDQINQDLKEAMKAKDTMKLSALRDIKSKLLLEATKEGGDGKIEESASMKILTKLYKQRIEAAELYKEQSRDDLYQEEITQAEVIKAYLPEQMSPEKLKEVISEIVSKTGASSMADMGKVMGMASKELAGKADGKAISEVVKSLLS